MCCRCMCAYAAQACVVYVRKYVYLGGQRAMVPARLLLYSWRSVRFGMAEGCAHVDGMLPATHQDLSIALIPACLSANIMAQQRTQ